MLFLERPFFFALCTFEDTCVCMCICDSCNVPLKVLNRKHVMSIYIYIYIRVFFLELRWSDIAQLL